MNDAIVLLPVEDVFANPRHYREVRPRAVEKLAASIAIIGQTDPVLVRRDGAIYFVESGHHRLAAIKSLGLAEIRAIVLDDLDEKKAAQLMVAANLHEPETELERSRGAQLMLSVGVRPLEASAHLGESTDRVSKAARAFERLGDATHAEDLTLEQAAAASEFDDDDAFRAIMNAPDHNWRRVWGDYDRARRLEASIERANTIAAESGCTILADSNESYGHKWLARGTEKPEGALYVRVTTSEWQASADLNWYGEKVDTETDAARSAEREAAEATRALLAAASARRRAWVAEYLSGTSTNLSNGIRDFAVLVWERGEFSADVNDLSEEFAELRGFNPRVYAAILCNVDGEVSQALRQPDGWPGKEDKGLSAAYFAAIEGCGYEPCDVERDALAMLPKEAGDEDA